MGESKLEDMSLPALFEQARKVHTIATVETADPASLKKACEALEHCEEMISKLGLFSSNELKEDISSFLSRGVTEKVAQSDRIQALKISQMRLKEFISVCERLELVPEEERLELTSVQERPDTFVARSEKKKVRVGPSNRSWPEPITQAWLTTIYLALCKAANQARFSKPALPITCATFALDVLEGGAKASEAHEHRHQPLTFGPASLISGNLTTEKERMAAQVFQPGYRDGRNNRPRNDDEEEDDAAVRKARAWDDWKHNYP
ncbi:hypothetical protein AMTRI_Chr01g111430 [Amborella trichopoda]